MQAAFDSTCPTCGDDIYEGDSVWHDTDTDTYVCVECAAYYLAIDNDELRGRQ